MFASKFGLEAPELMKTQPTHRRCAIRSGAELHLTGGHVVTSDRGRGSSHRSRRSPCPPGSPRPPSGTCPPSQVVRPGRIGRRPSGHRTRRIAGRPRPSGTRRGRSSGRSRRSRSPARTPKQASRRRHASFRRARTIPRQGRLPDEIQVLGVVEQPVVEDAVRARLAQDPGASISRQSYRAATLRIVCWKSDRAAEGKAVEISCLHEVHPRLFAPRPCRTRSLPSR